MDFPADFLRLLQHAKKVRLVTCFYIKIFASNSLYGSCNKYTKCPPNTLCKCRSRIFVSSSHKICKCRTSMLHKVRLVKNANASARNIMLCVYSNSSNYNVTLQERFYKSRLQLHSTTLYGLPSYTLKVNKKTKILQQ